MTALPSYRHPLYIGVTGVTVDGDDYRLGKLFHTDFKGRPLKRNFFIDRKLEFLPIENYVTEIHNYHDTELRSLLAQI